MIEAVVEPSSTAVAAVTALAHAMRMGIMQQSCGVCKTLYNKCGHTGKTDPNLSYLASRENRLQTHTYHICIQSPSVRGTASKTPGAKMRAAVRSPVRLSHSRPRSLSRFCAYGGIPHQGSAAHHEALSSKERGNERAAVRAWWACDSRTYVSDPKQMISLLTFGTCPSLCQCPR